MLLVKCVGHGFIGMASHARFGVSRATVHHPREGGSALAAFLGSLVLATEKTDFYAEVPQKKDRKADSNCDQPVRSPCKKRRFVQPIVCMSSTLTPPQASPFWLPIPAPATVSITEGHLGLREGRVVGEIMGAAMI